VDPTLPSIEGSQGDLEQLFLNLITNARDAMPGLFDVRAAASASARETQHAAEDSPGSLDRAFNLAQVIRKHSWVHLAGIELRTQLLDERQNCSQVQ
jgi:signal transduction histidine kinase